MTYNLNSKGSQNKLVPQKYEIRSKKTSRDMKLKKEIKLELRKVEKTETKVKNESFYVFF